MSYYVIKPMETADEIDGKGYVHYGTEQEIMLGMPNIELRMIYEKTEE